MSNDSSKDLPASDPVDPDATLAMEGRIGRLPGVESPGDLIGRYRLVEPLGQGGFGSVWRAEQHEPIHREVALKVIKAGMDSVEIIARFEAERQALALMDHPNIAAVLDAGTTENGRPFFVMELVRGVPITRYCDEHHLTIRQRVELFIPVCQAVQHAHQKAILHRDLKPSNILVMEVDGKAVPKVIDFGIAKALDLTSEPVLHAELAQTIEGMVVGTPQYMSPEQAGSMRDVDTRSDIYTLGVILYELLAGEPPLGREQLKQAALDEVLRLIREGEAKRPSSRFNPVSDLAKMTADLRNSEPKKLGEAIRGDLDWIVMRTLEKDRNRRYETANALALDLGRHLKDEPVLAGPPSVSYRFGKFVRRQKGPLSAAAAVFLVLVAGVVVSLWQAKVARTEAVRASNAEQIAEQRREAAERAQALADEATRTAEERAETIRRNLYVAEMNAAAEAAARPDGLNTVANLIEKWQPNGDEPDLRGWEWYYLKSLLHQEVATLSGHKGRVTDVAYSPDGSRIASCSYDKTVRVWDAVTLEELHVFTGHTQAISAIAWSPTGDRIVSAGNSDKTMRIWDAETGVEIRAIRTDVPVERVNWSPDGSQIASGESTAQGRIWDSRTGEEVRMIHGDRVSRHRSLQLNWRPGHEQISISQGMVMRLTDFEDSSPLKSPEMWITQGFKAWSPDGARFAAAGSAYIEIWDADTRKMIKTLEGHSGSNISSISWSPDGERLASAAVDTTIRLWEWISGKHLGTLRGHQQTVSSISWSPNGFELSSSSNDGTIRIWNLRPFVEVRDSFRSSPLNHTVAWHPDGERILVAGRNMKHTGPAVTIWDVEEQRRLLEIELPTMKATPDCIWSPDGARIAGLDGENTFWLWDSKTGEVVASRQLPDFFETGSQPRISWQPGGNLIACGGRSKDAFVFEPGFADPPTRINLLGRNFSSLIWNPTGTRLLLAGGVMWNSETEEQQKFTRSFDIMHADWSPDGTSLVAANSIGGVQIQSLTPGEPILELNGHNQSVSCLKWSPDGIRVATGGSGDRTVRIWDAATGSQLAILHGHEDVIMSLAWSPDGTRLLSGGRDRMILWDASKAYEAEAQRTEGVR